MNNNLLKDAYIFVKEEYLSVDIDKVDENNSKNFFNQNQWFDGKVIFYFIEELRKFNYTIKLINFDSFIEEKPKEKSLLIFPHNFISGTMSDYEKLKNKIKLATDAGCSMIFSHHNKLEIEDFIDAKYIDYKSHKVKYNIINDHIVLTKDILEFLANTKFSQDEYSYIKTGQSFSNLIEKVWTPKGEHEYICFGYQQLENDNFGFLIDVHRVDGAKGWQGNFFQKLLRNTLLFLDSSPTKRSLGNEEERSEGTVISVENTLPSRISTQFERIVRDTSISKHLKETYQCRCQICNIQLNTKSGLYAECAHIKPLGTPHNGPDVQENVLCLCPNHHVLFDGGMVGIADDYSIIGGEGKLIVDPSHTISKEYLKYHREKIMGID